MDGASQLTYSENLSYGEDDPISAHSQSPCELGNTRHHGGSPRETSVVHSLSRQSTEGSLEMETAFNNRGFEDSYATDGSSVWTPEASCLFSTFSWLEYCQLPGSLFPFPSPFLSSLSPHPSRRKFFQKGSIALKNKHLNSL